MYGCTGVQVPPFHTFYSHALGCVGMRCHSLYYWKLLEPPGTPRILLDVPHPQYLKYMAGCAHWCAGPPFHTFYSHALGCVGMRCHSLLLLETIGTTWYATPLPFHTIPMLWAVLACVTILLLVDIRTTWNSWMSPPQYLKCMAALMCRSPPSIMTNRKPAVGVGELIAGVGGYWEPWAGEERWTPAIPCE